MKIRKRKNRRKGSISWQLDAGEIEGKRYQRSYPTKQEAEDAKVELKARLKSDGHRSIALSSRQQMDYFAAIEKLEPVGATLSEAVDFFLKHAPTRREVKPVKMCDLVEACLLAKQRENARPRYLVQLKSTTKALAKHVGEMTPAHQVTKADVEGWLAENHWAPVTRNNYVADVRTLFGWAIEQGHATANPCDGIKRVKVDDEEIAFVCYTDCERLFRRAEEARPARKHWDEKGRRVKLEAKDEDFRDFLPMLAVGFFAGLRPEFELGLMTKGDVKLDSKLVIVTSGRAKGRRRRPVDLPDNAIEWLRLGLSFLEGDSIMPRNFAKRWRRLRQECGFFTGRDVTECPRGQIPWPHDGMRHTFATAHLAHHRNEAALQVLMGHTSAQMLYAHYRGLMTPQEAARFYELRPRGGMTNGE